MNYFKVQTMELNKEIKQIKQRSDWNSQKVAKISENTAVKILWI